MLSQIISNKKISEDTFILSLDCSGFHSKVTAGQFYMVGIPGHCEIVLRRPFSVCDFNGKILKIAYKVIGKGTSVLSRLKKGNCIDLLGPFGNGFKFPGTEENIIFVAGGIGVAPFLLFAREVRKTFKSEKSVTLLYGGRTSSDFALKKSFLEFVDESLVSTEDGSEGFRGYVTELLEKKTKSLKTPKKAKTIIYASGPRAMLKKVDEFSQRTKIVCQLSAETVMGCGYGICLGCAVENNKARQSGKKKHSLVCKDGPVFESGEIKW